MWYFHIDRSGQTQAKSKRVEPVQFSGTEFQKARPRGGFFLLRGETRMRDMCPTPAILRGVDVLDRVLKIIDSFNRAGVEYVVVGGVAVNLHGLLRATEDLDVFVRPEPKNVERLRAALRDVWKDPSIEEIRAEDLCGEYPAVRYGPPEGDLYLDILTRLGEMTAYDDLTFETKVVEGTEIRVATPETLYKMKKGTVRPIDHADARALRAAFDFEED